MCFHACFVLSISIHISGGGIVKTLTELLEGGRRLLFLDNLNVDISTFDPGLFYKLKDISEQMNIEEVYIMGNLWTALGDYTTFSRDRDWTIAHFKRSVGDDYPGFKKKWDKTEGFVHIADLSEKVDYVKHLFSGWKVNRINYILGSHDRLIMMLRTVGALNELVSQFDLTSLRRLGGDTGRADYVEQILRYIIVNHPSLIDDITDCDVKKFKNNFKKVIKDVEASILKPIEKMRSKSDLGSDVITKYFKEMEQQYRAQLAGLGQRFELRGFNYEPDIDDYHFKIMANQSRFPSPSINGFNNMKDLAKEKLANIEKSDERMHDILVQGVHGFFGVSALRRGVGSFEHSYLLQIPSFELHRVAQKYRMLATAGLETIIRHKRINAPLGAVFLELPVKGRPITVGYLDEGFIRRTDDISKLKLKSKASLNDVHRGNAMHLKTLFDKSLDTILEINPDFLNIGGDQSEGGKYPSFNFENSMPPPEYAAKRVRDILSKSGEPGLVEYLESHNQPLHNQFTMAFDTYNNFFAKFLRDNPGDKTIMFNDGNHLRILLQKEGFKLSFGQLLLDNVADFIDGSKWVSESYGKRYKDVFEDGTIFYRGKTPRGLVDLICNSDGLSLDSDWLHGHRYWRAHSFKKCGNAARGVQKHLLDGQFRKYDIIEGEHYHSFDIIGMGKVIYISNPCFLDTTQYAEGSTWGKGMYHDSVIGFINTIFSEGPDSLKLFKLYIADVIDNNPPEPFKPMSKKMVDELAG